MIHGRKAVWSIPYVSVAFFPRLKHNFIAYYSSKVTSRPDCIFEIHQLWQSGFSKVYSNCCCSCWFEPEIIKIGQSSHKMYSNNSEFSRVYDNFKCLYKKKKKKSGNLLKAPYIYIYISWPTVVDGEPKNPFSIATTLGWKEGCNSFPWIVLPILDPYHVILSVKQEDIKNHF